MKLNNKKIILGITGSIAAYKAAFLLRLLVKEGADVKVLITPSGKEFITPVTLSALSGKPVDSEFFVNTDGSWHSHVDLGLWADLMLIAPATANTMGKMTLGIADNLLITSYLSARCPVFIAPAMDLDMYKHPAVQKNIQTLQSYGNRIIEPDEGELASGLSGKGRMAEPENIVEQIISFFERKKELSGKRVLLTAGPTYEQIDPVRFIGNYSSGKMGYALAEELADRGAKVVLVSGPVEREIYNENIEIIRVKTAAEMLRACIEEFPLCDAAILAAAVADFTPVQAEDIKIKRKKENYSIELKPTTDIAAELGRVKKLNQIMVGFALETDKEEQNAFAKLKRKNFDFIVLNSLRDEGAGFGTDTNLITIIDKNNNRQKYELKPKKLVAIDIVDKLCSLL